MKSNIEKRSKRFLTDLFRAIFDGTTSNRFSKVWARKFPKPKVRALEFFYSAKFEFSTARIRVRQPTKARLNQSENGLTNTE
ncbi:MAG: hypothetical protein WKF90_16785 [Pyrinomonadaceae bacterium]